MIKEVLEFIIKKLEESFKPKNTDLPPTEAVIAFTEEITDTVKFPNNHIVPLIIQIEEDKRFLLADRWSVARLRCFLCSRRLPWAPLLWARRQPV